jgi:hypothetical protein
MSELGLDASGCTGQALKILKGVNQFDSRYQLLVELAAIFSRSNKLLKTELVKQACEIGDQIEIEPFSALRNLPAEPFFELLFYWVKKDPEQGISELTQWAGRYAKEVSEAQEISSDAK